MSILGSVSQNGCRDTDGRPEVTFLLAKPHGRVKIVSYTLDCLTSHHRPSRYAAELHDFLNSDVKRWYPDLRHKVIGLLVLGRRGGVSGIKRRQALQCCAHNLYTNCFLSTGPSPTARDGAGRVTDAVIRSIIARGKFPSTYTFLCMISG